MSLPLELIIHKKSYSEVIGYNSDLKRIIKNKDSRNMRNTKYQRS